MIVCIPKVLAPEQLSQLRADIESGPFVDGRSTAAEPAK
jgi:predicted 2-oxoglutarate/Fe(II)-dependent dioxygenase YbiX